MKRVLAFCWREWRAQRAVLLGFLGLGLAALAGAFTLLPDGWWQVEGRTLLALSWFPALGLLGVGAFVAPALVRSEDGARGEQFVQRLPGALLPALLGKLLFLLLATAAMPLVCLLAGEGVLAALGRPFQRELFVATFDGELQWGHADRFWPLVAGAGWLLLAPWVWAAGTWLPKGRMAIGGVVLLGMLVGLAVTAVLRQHYALEKGIAWQDWIGYVPIAGLGVAAASWLVRRAGGPLRSARAGLAATLLALAPPAAWLAAETHRYRHPDLGRLQSLSVHAVTPDATFALVRAAEHPEWSGPQLRVDLRTGAAHELPSLWYVGETLRRWPFDRTGSSRFWRAVTHDEQHSLFDLATGTSAPLPLDAATQQPIWPPELKERVLRDLLANASFRNADGRRWVVVDGELVRDGDGGALERAPWPGGDGLLRPAGHGASMLRRGAAELFDDRGHRASVVADGNWGAAFLVRDRWLYVRAPVQPALGRWHQLEPDGTTAPVAALAGAQVLGLASDDHVLCLVTARPQRDARLFLYGPADHSVADLPLPDGFAVHHANVEQGSVRATTSLLPRDPAGRIWLRCWQSQAMAARTLRRGDGLLCVDPAAQTASLCPWDLHGSWRRLLAWPDAHTVVAQEDARIVRIDVATGARTRLFPR